MSLHKLSGWQISEKLKKKEIGLGEVVSFFQERVQRLNPKIKAVISLFDEPLGPEKDSDSKLWGVPVLIKDNICIKNKEITCASKILKGFISPYNATVIERLRKAGLVILGTANMDEFAFGSSCENSCYGPTLNPWNESCVPGGSSGGCAAAVAAGLVPCALGSDTGGSIRQPASFCGAVGFKPTYGRVSRFGLVAFGSSLDQIGPISRDIVDSAYLLNIVSGKDSRDSTSASIAVPDFSKSFDGSLKGLKVGLPKEYFVSGLDGQVKKTVELAISVLKSKGIEFSEISLPHTEYAVPTYYILASSEASSNLSRFEGIRYGKRIHQNNLIELYKRTRQEGFGQEAKRRIMLGTFSLSSGYYEAYYLKALKVRWLIKKDFDQAFKAYDAIITPTSPTAAFKIGEKADNPLSMYLSDIYTISCNLSGVPSVSIPCGFTQEGLPVGLQLISKHFNEEMLIRLAHAYQESTDWHKQFPVNYE
ncbi:MAG: Asp-tRNA(Asn)/Glu-tRNA(Gln) amidotransferase subunit GatA [Candidatus Omnitrophica bacterium]|nr:Asp-tRNA(Asn)/Glu-tRNA(Gln) amidotransferase subunit GatA [Candidatus Omnitrophota bacterium]